ncbi:FxDxF family PEP-CTERM protein [Sphingomonas sp. MMS24-J13]|uniref:FxDxF family PEP-CTERM protein n=1 Tax=Sphingomonas sp. MMS24-J13 TaxID=3238686 RepID=UPI00385055B8
MRSVFCAIAATAAVFAVSSGANAATIGLAGDPATYLSGFFGSNVNGTFNNSWTFNVPADGVISSLVGSANVTGSSGLTFTSVSLNGVDLNFMPALPNQSFSFTDLPVNAGLQTLLISGSGKGSYSGTVAFAPFNAGGNPQSAVPEPASWALMLGGFGMVGGALRTTRRRNVAIKFA